MALPGDLLAVVAALTGALVGGVIAELRTVAQGSRVRRRVLRKVLFQLLELRLEVRNQDPRTFMQALKTVIVRKFGAEVGRELDTEDAHRILRSVVSHAIQTLAKRPTLDAYTRSVTVLAGVDPLLAYHLSGRDNLLELERQLARYFQAVGALEEFQTLDDQVIGRARTSGLEMAYASALDDLDHACRRVAIGISPWMWWRTRQVLGRQNRLPMDECWPQIDRYLDECMAKPSPGT